MGYRLARLGAHEGPARSAYLCGVRVYIKSRVGCKPRCPSATTHSTPSPQLTCSLRRDVRLQRLALYVKPSDAIAGSDISLPESGGIKIQFAS